MAKKIKFPLNLADGTQARSLEELKEHFDLESILGYYKNGKLLTWLRDRYFEAEAGAVEALDENAPDFQRALCEVFGVEFSGAGVDMEEIARRQERLARLRQFTDEDEFIRNIDSVAFDQEELADLLDEDCEKIYLCGERFTVPASHKGVTYVGVNGPVVHISGNVPERIEDTGITFVGVKCSNFVLVENGQTEAKEVDNISKEEKQRISERTSFKKRVTVYDNKRHFATSVIEKPEDIHPIFRNQFTQLNIASKFWLWCKYCNTGMFDINNAPQKLNALERYMLQQSGLLGYKNAKCNEEDMTILCIQSNGMPCYDMSTDDKIIIKKILRIHMSKDEEVLFDKLISDFHDQKIKFDIWNTMISSGNIYKPENGNELKNAILSGWFDNIDIPDSMKKFSNIESNASEHSSVCLNGKEEEKD